MREHVLLMSTDSLVVNTALDRHLWQGKFDKTAACAYQQAELYDSQMLT